MKGKSYALIDKPSVLRLKHSLTSRCRSVRVFEMAAYMSSDRSLSPLPANISAQTRYAYFNKENTIGDFSQGTHYLTAPKEWEKILHDLTTHSPEQGLAVAVVALQNEDMRICDIGLGYLTQQNLNDSEQGDIVLQLIAEMALMDASPQLRMAALNALANSHETYVRDLVGQAIHDPDPQISKFAQILLKRH